MASQKEKGTSKSQKRHKSHSSSSSKSKKRGALQTIKSVKNEDIHVLVLYDRKAKENKDLDIKKGETIVFLRKRVDWLEGINEQGKKGWFPKSFVRITHKVTGEQLVDEQFPVIPAMGQRDAQREKMAQFLGHVVRPDVGRHAKDKGHANGKAARMKMGSQPRSEPFFVRRPTLSNDEMTGLHIQYQVEEQKLALESKKASLTKKRKEKVLNKFIQTRKEQKQAIANDPDRDSVFGLSLEQMASLDASPEIIPRVIALAIDFLHLQATKIEGIFRVAGNQLVVEDMARKLYSSELTFLGGIAPSCETHAVAEFFKKLLREMPEPLFTYTLYQPLIDMVSSFNDAEGSDPVILDKLLDAKLAELPPLNFNVIEAVFGLIVEVAKNSDVNLMHKNNLATIFGPTLMRPPGDLDMLTCLNDQSHTVVLAVIEKYDRLRIRKEQEAEPSAQAKPQPTPTEKVDEVDTETETLDTETTTETENEDESAKDSDAEKAEETPAVDATEDKTNQDTKDETSDVDAQDIKEGEANNTQEPDSVEAPPVTNPEAETSASDGDEGESKDTTETEDVKKEDTPKKEPAPPMPTKDVDLINMISSSLTASRQTPNSAPLDDSSSSSEESESESEDGPPSDTHDIKPKQPDDTKETTNDTKESPAPPKPVAAPAMVPHPLSALSGPVQAPPPATPASAPPTKPTKPEPLISSFPRVDDLKKSPHPPSTPPPSRAKQPKQPPKVVSIPAAPTSKKSHEGKKKSATLRKSKAKKQKESVEKTKKLKKSGEKSARQTLLNNRKSRKERKKLTSHSKPDRQYFSLRSFNKKISSDDFGSQDQPKLKKAVTTDHIGKASTGDGNEL